MCLCVCVCARASLRADAQCVGAKEKRVPWRGSFFLSDGNNVIKECRREGREERLV
jgi:hypothetical protein